MRKKLFRKLTAGIIGTAIAVMSMPSVPGVMAYQETGEKDGYDWEFWTDGDQKGDNSMKVGGNGTFTCSWDCTDGTNTALMRSGKEFAGIPEWSSLNRIYIDYEADFQPDGSSCLCVCGWMLEPTVEYLICDSYGTWTPPGKGFRLLGTKVIDGAEYEIYEGEKTGPSITAGESYRQYWSVRKDMLPHGSIKSTITVSDHFAAWEELSGAKLGRLKDVALGIESWNSTGKAEITKNQIGYGSPGIPPTILSDDTNTTDPPKTDSDGYYFCNTFESGAESWSGRGSASVETSKSMAYAGSKSLLVTGRADEWNGAILSLGKDFKAGQSYSFSVNAAYDKGDTTRDFKLTLEYNNGTDTVWDEIATGTTYAGKWVQLSNTDYKLPAKGSDFKLIVETTDGTLEDFYIDDAVAAAAGTKIEGAGKPDLSSIPQPTTKQKPGQFIAGDVTCDGRVNAYDVAALRKVLVTKEYSSDNAKYASDVDANDEVNVSDLVLLCNYVLGKDVELKKPEMPVSSMRTISEYTPIAEKTLVMSEPDSSHQKKGGVDYGKLEKKSYKSDFCKRTKNYNVLLPAGYSTDKEYPVMYVLHGYYENPDRMILTGNDTMYTQQIVGNAIAEGAAKEMILVFPHVYSSATQDDVTGMDDMNNQAYDNFDTVLVNELMPLIEKDYSVATGRENTAITGFSMGGRESLQIGMKHPDLFGYVGAICPAPGATGSWKFASEEESPSLIYITAGGNDTVVYTTPEGYHNNFTKNNVPHVWHYYPNGYHGDNSIHAHLYNFVRWAFQA